MLKITGGTYRSRMIDLPEEGTVPTKNRVREALMSALCNDIPEARVLDLFAGSGALGIETLSRGASFCDFVDLSPRACKVIEGNLRSLKEERAKVHALDYRNALKAFQSAGKRFDIVFLDPPYADLDAYQEAVKTLEESGLLSERAALVLEFEGELEYQFAGFARQKRYNYGRTHVLILRKSL